jgi:hypothetical protein
MNLQDVKNLEKNDVLGLLGLQTKESETSRLLGTLGAFGVGLLAGAGVALLLAPKPGRELREDIRSKLRRGDGDGVESSGASAGSIEVGPGSRA